MKDNLILIWRNQALNIIIRPKDNFAVDVMTIYFIVSLIVQNKFTIISAGCAACQQFVFRHAQNHWIGWIARIAKILKMVSAIESKNCQLQTLSLAKKRNGFSCDDEKDTNNPSKP